MMKPSQRCSSVVYGLALLAFLLVLARTTDWMYLKTEDHRVLDPRNIIASTSLAPNQYRVLQPVLFRIVDATVLHDARRSDHAIIFLSIILAYASAGALFFRATRSVPLTGLSLLALLGCFAFGMMYKYRQEFFEVAFVALALLAVLSFRRKALLYAALALLTLFGTLNRETFLFCLTGVAAHILWQRVVVGRERIAPHIVGLAVLAAMYALCYFGVRWYFGPRPYFCEFWQWQANLGNLLHITSPYNVLYLGAGVGLLYVAALAKGNREYLVFIVGYAAPMLAAAALISQFGEHRVLYPIMLLCIASVLRFGVRSFTDISSDRSDESDE